jgi:ABC-2 type transport system ATP-binding protein
MVSMFIEASNLGKIYTDFYAVKDLSFSVEEGGIFGFIGPNGAGKTTTLRMITGILDPTEGSCRVNGLDVVDDKIKVKAVTGYLPEEDFLYGDMSVRDHLRYIAELYGVGDVDDAVNRSLELVDMKPNIDDVIKHLSKGQRRRVAIAKTLVHDPQLVVLDEVTSGLDPVYARKMINVINNLHAAGKTIVFSTHLLDEATRLCDRVLIINRGLRVGYGSIQEVLEETGAGSLEEAFFKLID